MVEVYACAMNCSNVSNGLTCIEFLLGYGIKLSRKKRVNLVTNALDTAEPACIAYLIHTFGLVWHATPRDTVKCVRRGVDVVQAVMRLAASVTWSEDGQECCTAVSCKQADCLKFIVEDGATWNDEVCKRVVILAIYYGSVECLEFAIDKCSDFALLATELKTEGLPVVLKQCGLSSYHRAHYYTSDDDDDDNSNDDDLRSSESSMDSPDSASTSEDDESSSSDVNKDDLCDMAAHFGYVDVLRLLHVKAGHPIYPRALVTSSTPKCFSYVLDALESETPWYAEQVWEGRNGKTLINNFFSSEWMRLSLRDVKVVALLSRRFLSSSSRRSCGIISPHLRMDWLERVGAEIKLPRHKSKYSNNERRKRVSVHVRRDAEKCQRSALVCADTVVEPALRAVRRIETAWIDYAYAPYDGRPGYERTKATFINELSDVYG